MADASMIIREDGHYVVTDHQGNSSVWTKERSARKWLKKRGALKKPKPPVTISHGQYTYMNIISSYAFPALVGSYIAHIVLHFIGFYG